MLFQLITPVGIGLCFKNAAGQQHADGLAADGLATSVKTDYDRYLAPLFEHFHRNPELSTIETETAARMAQEAGVPIVPVITWGGQRIYTKGRKPDFRTRGRAISITVGEPIEVPPDSDPAEVTEHLRTVMAQLLDETIRAHPQGPDGPDDTWWLPPAYGGTALTREQAHEIEESERQARLAARRARDQAVDPPK